MTSHTYTFDVYVFPGGEALVPGNTNADAWYSSLDEVQPNGTDILTDSEETEDKQSFSLEEIKESVRSSKASYGKEAIPESLRFFLRSPARQDVTRFAPTGLRSFLLFPPPLRVVLK